MINGSEAVHHELRHRHHPLVTVTAVTGPEVGRPQADLDSILVPVRRRPSIVEPAYDKVGWHASDTHPLTFDDMPGAPGEPARRTRPRLRQFLAHPGRGPDRDRRHRPSARPRAASTSASRYAKEREAFGRPIGNNQAIAFKIARMETARSPARQAYYDAAALMLAGKPFKKEASIAKLVGSEAAMDNARDATQIFGGYGFMNEFPVARHYRDSKILEIGEGTTEVQLMLSPASWACEGSSAVTRCTRRPRADKRFAADRAPGQGSSPSPREGLHHPGRTGPTELLGHPDAGGDQRFEVDAGLDAEAVERPHQVLGGQVAGGALGVRAASEPAGRGVDRGDPGFEGGDGVGESLTVGVVEVHGHVADRHSAGLEGGEQILDVARGGDPDGVTDAQLIAAEAHQPAGHVDHLTDRDVTSQGSPKHIDR